MEALARNDAKVALKPGHQKRNFFGKTDKKQILQINIDTNYE